MKKIFALTSILALCACGGGSGGGGAENSAFGGIEIPTQVSDTANISNQYVTGMNSSVSNIGDMTAAVENVIGASALNTIVNNSESIQNAMNRAALRSASGGAYRNHSNKNKGAYIFVEEGQRFKNFGHEKKQQFFLEQPDIVRYWGSVFCGCDVDSYNTDDLLAVFDDDANKENWNNFYNKNHYREYTLENVEFTMAAASGGGGDEGGAKDLLTFELEKEGENRGQIKAINHVALVKNGDSLVESPDESATFVRNGAQTNTFDVGQINGEGKIYTGNGNVVTYGRDVGLQYSDFGQLVYDLHWTKNGASGDEKSYEPFAGGYKDLRKESPDVAMNFTGKAVGSVSNDGFNKNISGDATLAFNSGKESLHMDFSKTAASADDTPWYIVDIVRNNSDSNDNSIKFTTNSNLNTNIPSQLQFNNGFTDGVRTPVYHLVDGYNGGTYGEKAPNEGYGKWDIGYYGGTDGVITEAAGVTQYVETGSYGEIRMNVGFGATKD